MKQIMLVATFLLLIAGCRSDPFGTEIPPLPPPAATGVYVLNEGNFNDPTGARLSLYDIKRDTVYLDVFESANGGAHLGSLGDDIKLHNGRAYILMSGSKELKVINLSNHQLVQTVPFPGSTPHAILIDSLRNQIFVTRLYSNSIYVLSLSTLAVIDSITVGSNPQGMLLVNDQLFVCNSGYGASRTVSVINPNIRTLKTTIRVGDGPTEAVVAPDGRIWVACTGDAFGTPATRGRISIINPISNTVVDSMLFTENIWGSIATDNAGTAYIIGRTDGSFYGGPIHKIVMSTKAIGRNHISGTLYALAIDHAEGDLYLSDVKGFTSNGQVYVVTKEGVLKKTLNVQRGPGAFAFKR